MKYIVSLMVDAWISIEVEANNEKEAMEKASDHKDCHVSVCNFCSEKLQVGDILWNHKANTTEEI